MTARHFNTLPLGSLLEVPPQNGYSPICPAMPTGKWVLGLSALDGYGLDLAGAKPAPLGEPLVDRFLLEPGDFLISRSNTLDKVGRVGVFRGGLDNCAYPDLMMRFRPDCEKINPDYLETYLKSDGAVKFIRQHATGTSGSMKKINQGTVEAIPILVPPINEQVRIASILGAWYEAIEKTERLIAAKERLYSVLLTTLVHQPAKKKRWHQKHLGEIATIRKGQQLNVADMIDDGKYYALNGGIRSSGRTDKWNTPENTITISEGGNSCGYVNFNPEKFWCGGHCYALIDISDLADVRFLFHYLKSRQAKLMALRVGSGLPNIQKNDIESFTVNIYPLPEQHRIASVLDAARVEITHLENLVTAYKIQKRGLMQKLLTGQWRVKIAEEVGA
ncbi:MAG: restriction endonuclease subunit S [Anaerolineales bacterium]|nr:restriction endonuclease subunit S [Anaerolineales bacterium]